MDRDAANSPDARKRLSPKRRVPLSRDEIVQLDAALTQAFRTVRDLRERVAAAKHIKLPPLPSIFSESIIIAVAPRLFGLDWTATYGGTTCNVLIQNGR